jgi:hypothetical protein
MFECDGTAEVRAPAVIAKIRADVLVQPELACLDELHDGRGGECLRDRSDAERGRPAVDRQAPRGIRVAVSPSEQHLTVAHDRDSDSCCAVLLQFFGNERIE